MDRAQFCRLFSTTGQDMDPVYSFNPGGLSPNANTGQLDRKVVELQPLVVLERRTSGPVPARSC